MAERDTDTGLVRPVRCGVSVSVGISASIWESGGPSLSSAPSASGPGSAPLTWRAVGPAGSDRLQALLRPALPLPGAEKDDERRTEAPTGLRPAGGGGRRGLLYVFRKMDNQPIMVHLKFYRKKY